MNGNLQNNRKNCQYSFINDNILYAINKPKTFKKIFKLIKRKLCPNFIGNQAKIIFYFM